MKIDFSAALKTDKETPKKPEVVESTPFDAHQLDVERATMSFSTMVDQMNLMVRQANEIKVIDADSNEKANQMLIQCRQILKTVDTIRLEMPEFKRASEFVNKVNAFVRTTFKKKLELEIPKQILMPKISEYHKAEAELKKRIAEKKAKEEAEQRRKIWEAEQKKKREAEEKARLEAIERQKALDAKAKKEGVAKVEVEIPEVSEIEPPPPDIEPVIEKVESKVKTDGGTSKVETVWECKIVDPDKVPREYCVPDMKLLKNAVNAGIRNIDGCKITEEFITKIRVKSK